MIDYRSINRARSRKRFAGASRAVSALVVSCMSVAGSLLVGWAAPQAADEPRKHEPGRNPIKFLLDKG